MLPWGRDFYDPDQTSDQIELLIRKSAEELGIPIKSVTVTTPSHYFRDVENSAVSLPTYTYDFNPPLLIEDLRGQYGERPADKLAERQVEERLESSEKFSSIAGFYGQSYPIEQLQSAWVKVLFNQEHDQVPGSHPDDVDKETMSRYHGALEAGRVTLNEALYNLSRKVDTSKYGDFPFLVFNCLSYPRTEVVHYEPAVSLYKDTSGSETTNFRILDDLGNVQPFWLVSGSHYSRFLSMAVVEFMATVPALGYGLYRIEKMEGQAQPQRWRLANEEISNRFFVLHLDRTTGLISSLVDRRSGRELLNTTHYGGNEVVLKEEKNPELEGPIHFTGDEIRTRGIQPDCIEQIDHPLGIRLRVQKPFLGGLLTQEIALFNELPRIDFKVKLLGFPGHDGMLMVVFPLRGGATMESYYEINNAVIQRPNGIYGGQTWAGLQDSSGGVAILNQGTSGYQIENGNINLILLRSVTHYQFYYSPKASEAGSHEFNYSLCSYQGNWSDSVVTEQAHSFNSPLRVITTGTHPGSLPPKQGFLSVESGHFEVTALKKAEQGDDLILRGYEIKGKGETVRLRIGLPVLEAHLADLLERGGEELPVRQNRIEFQCRPFEFITMRLRVEHDQIS